MNALRRRILSSLLLLGLLVGGSPAATFGQTPGVTVAILGQGYLPYAEAVDGPADVVMATVVLAPGARTGWHLHEGPVWAVVTQGELSIYEDDGCRVSYPTGSVRVEIPGDVHEGRNEGAAPVELQLMYLVPAGSALSVEVPALSAVCTPGR